jgi:hypothetical protein
MVLINIVPDNNPHGRGIDLYVPPLPPRSRLVSLRPIGVGTGMVESLWGYIVRLSSAHSVSFGDLWREVSVAAYIDLVQPPFVSLKGKRALSITAALERLTLRRDVAQTTLVAAEKNSEVVLKTASVRAWCNTCLETDEEPYDRLLWNVGLGCCCSIHKRPLRRHCPACGRTQSVFAHGSRIMRCAWCKESLTTEHRHSIAEPTQYDLWSSREVAAFIAHFDSHPRDPKAIGENLNCTIELCGGIKPTARRLRASPGTIRSWLRGTNGMSMESVLRWAWLISVPAVDLFTREVQSTDMIFRDAPPKKKGLSLRKKAKPTPQDFLLALGKFLRERPMDVPTLTAIARIVGVCVKSAAARSPQVLDAISAARFQRQMAIRKARIWRTICEVHSAVSWLAKGGRSITARNIRDYLGKALTRDPLVQRYIYNLQQQRNSGRIPSNPNKRLPQDVQSFWKLCDLI